jgi:hypothetical protein
MLICHDWHQAFQKGMWEMSLKNAHATLQKTMTWIKKFDKGR